MTVVDVIGFVVSMAIGYALIATTTFLVWPPTWPLRLLAAYAWPATLYMLAIAYVHGAVERR